MVKKRGNIIGVDEAGRGAWAGPVVAAACCLMDQGLPRDFLGKVQDSKKISERRREELFDQIVDLSHQELILYAAGSSTASKIDRVGIREANRLAMLQAIQKLEISTDKIIIDGRDNYVFRSLHTPVEFLVKGDSKILEIMIASIVAKVTRDRKMRKLDLQFPGYGFSRHKGYGTKLHQKALHDLGVIPAHRMSYEPIRVLL